MKRKERKEKVAQMTNPVRQILGCGFFDCFFFSSLFLNVFLFSPSWFFFLFFCFLLVCFLFCSCSLCVSDDTTCFRSATRNYPEKLTCQPRLHLLCSADTCWRKATDVDCPRTSPVWGSQPPLSLREVGFSPTSPQTPPQCTPFFFFSLSFFFFGAPQERSAQLWDCTVCAERRLQIVGVKPLPLATSVRAGEHSPEGRVRGRRRGSGSAVFCESRARSHQKPARSNSKLSVEPRQNWGASSQDFLNLLFLPTTFSFSFVLFYIYTCICVCIFSYKYTYIHTYIYRHRIFIFFILYHFAFWPAGRGKE